MERRNDGEIREHGSALNRRLLVYPISFRFGSLALVVRATPTETAVRVLVQSYHLLVSTSSAVQREASREAITCGVIQWPTPMTSLCPRRFRTELGERKGVLEVKRSKKVGRCDSWLKSSAEYVKQYFSFLAKPGETARYYVIGVAGDT